jgi:hypothetical protein
MLAEMKTNQEMLAKKKAKPEAILKEMKEEIMASKDEKKE